MAEWGLGLTIEELVVTVGGLVWISLKRANPRPETYAELGTHRFGLELRETSAWTRWDPHGRRHPADPGNGVNLPRRQARIGTFEAKS